MIRPFSCGTQYVDWENSNCCRCTKYTDDASGCEIMQALSVASIGDGTISDEIAERMGYSPDTYVWPCTEVEWTEEWKREYAAKWREKNTLEMPI